jgi:hypothetical protein
MKKILINSLVLGFFMACLSSCYKDLGNYTYHDINQISFTGIDTVNGYNALLGDSLKISPTLVMTKDQSPSLSNYSYAWSFHLTRTPGVTFDSIISTDKNLKTKITLKPGTYFLQYTVTDKATGVAFHVRTNLLVSTPIYEGYMVLNDVNGHSRLDMLSYNKTVNAFTQNTDVLAKVGSTVPMQGQPYQVLCMYYTRTRYVSVKYYGIFLLNASGTNRVNEETFAYDPTYNIRNLMIGDVPANFSAQSLTGDATSGFPLFFMYSGGNMYSYTAQNGSAFKYLPLNIYHGSSIPFKVSPYVATDGNVAVMYNMDKRNFVTTVDVNSVEVTDVPVGLNYPTGLDLVYMERNYSTNTYAILKDPNTSKYYLLRFALGKAQDYYQEITGTDFANASHYAVSPDLGYLFYSVGGKLYEYDLSLKTSTLMLDKGQEQISYLSFQQFTNRVGTYINWAKLLTVGSYNPTGTAGSNGTLELYSVPPVNGQIVQTNKWTGLGKIVSVSYRERY